MNLRSTLHSALLCLLCLPAAALPQEEVRERWGELFLTLREPVVTQTAVENAARLARMEAEEERLARQKEWMEEEEQQAASPAPARPTAEDCGLHLFTIRSSPEGAPAPKLRWVDQNKLKIDFAPDSSPNVGYQLDFAPGTTYLSGAPLATTRFTFRCKPVELHASWLQEHAGGAALVSALGRDTKEAQRIVEQHEGLRVHFRRMRHIPLVGWVCTGTVPARLRPATLHDGLGGQHRLLMGRLLSSGKPEALREDTPLPQCLVAVPQQPLVPGMRYELGVEATADSGVASENLDLGRLSEGLYATLERELKQEKGAEPHTRLSLHFSHPVPEAQLRALWEQLHITANGVEVPRQADGTYRADIPCGEAGQTTPLCLRLRELIPTSTGAEYWHEGRQYHYAPKGCAQGLDIEVLAGYPMDLALTLPQGVQGRHGLALCGERCLRAGISPTAPALTGNGCNYVALSGSHVVNLPLVNVGAVRATAYHWEAADAARLLPLIQHGMRDDTIFCELWQRLCWLRSRAKEGFSTDGNDEDARAEAGRALLLLQKARRDSDSVRTQALAAATVFEPQELAVKLADKGNGLRQQGWAAADLEQLTGGTLRPGLYLLSLTYSPTPEVMQALRAYGMQGNEPGIDCTVDFLIQVTDMQARYGADRLLVNSLVDGQPVDGAQVRLYVLPQRSQADSEEEILASALEEAYPTEGQAPQQVQQGVAKLPKNAAGTLLLLQRGEDYTLFSLWGESVRARSGNENAEPMLALFCDRPLYRPGETAHLRGVLRCPAKGELALPKQRKATLALHKPNGELLETRELTVDAYGAFATDITLPKGEDDVTGRYRCRVQVEEAGKMVEEELRLNCQVFRRDAFRVTMKMELDPVAPKQYKVTLQATDYNDTPLAGGKAKLELSSTVPLRDEAGKVPAGLRHPHGDNFCELTRELVLDAEGRASVSGSFGTYDEERILNASASVSNDREEYVKVPRQYEMFSPADFTFEVDAKDRLHLIATQRKGEESHPLNRAQEVDIVVVSQQDEPHELPCGIRYTAPKEHELARHRITVPANCHEGIELLPFEVKDLRGRCILHLSARDAEGRLIRTTHRIYHGHFGGANRLTAEGRSVRMRCDEAFERGGRVHACISSQGRLRHTLVAVEAGAKEVDIPLSAQEYGEVAVTLISCEEDEWGLFTTWNERSASCELPRPDKALTVEFTLPAGAKPGEKVALSGRVLGADGQPVRAAVTLFAVDAGMMSVSPYTLPELATCFYRGEAGSFSLEGTGYNSVSREPNCLTLPSLWASEGGSWHRHQPEARFRSLFPAGMGVGSWQQGDVGSVFRFELSDVIRWAQPNFRWSDLLDLGLQQQQMQYEAAPAPAPVTVGEASYTARRSKAARPNSLRSGSGVMNMTAVEEMEEGPGDSLGEGGAGLGMAASRAYALAGEAPRPRLRSHFEPVALWLASLESAEDGSFVAECTLPDTLTTYKVYAVALDASGSCFGQAEGEFLVNQELMLTAGTPFFMSTGDKLLLPLTVTNNRDEAGAWTVTLEGAGEVAPQQVRLEAKSTATLYFEVKAGEEGTSTLRWTARSMDGADAVEGTFLVRYPAPLLKEAHRLMLAEGGEATQTAELLAAEVAAATRGEVEVSYSTSPLIHLAGGVDFLLNYPYGCTEQRASRMLPWIYYEQLMPFCPQMALTSAAEAKKVVEETITQLLARQQEDGGLSYWAVEKDERGISSPWASAYAGLVFTLAQEQGIAVPQEAMEKLKSYLGRQSWRKSGYLTQYAVARTRGRSGEVNRILVRALRQELLDAKLCGFERNIVDLEFMGKVRSNPGGRHEALLSWLRSKAKDYRHRTSWSGGWTLIALSEYLRLEPKAGGSGTVNINGTEYATEGKPGRVCFKPGAGQSLRNVAPVVAAGKGSCYVSVRVKAQPEQTEYPGVTEKGLQVTRVYEVRDENGLWKQTNKFKVGDVVRITLTCAKIADELEYFVLEDYLPSCMEAINPNVPGQAVGLEDGGRGFWSRWFDHKEYLADRVRGFCTRWGGRDVVNMCYYARVKRAGDCTAAPAAAQLMYEPQTYGLSANARVRAE